MVFGDIADSLTRSIDAVGASAREAFFEPVIRLGVTGPSRSGKTVFITALVHNLMNRSNMGGLVAQAEGRISAAYLQPQPDVLIPRFAYEDHLAAMTGANPRWPEGTRTISQLRLSFRIAPSGLLGAVSGPRRVHLDIIDYPGEWLLDLALLDQDYAGWSTSVLSDLKARDYASRFLVAAQETSADTPHNEEAAVALARSYTDCLRAGRDEGFPGATPGRFLLPGDLADSPALTFAPLPDADRPPRGSLGREMARRYSAYKNKVIRPFFKDHFARIDRQIVLVDPLGALARGPSALGDLQSAMAATLTAFRPGKNGTLARLLRGRKVDKILFAATKADSLHHSQHEALTALLQSMLREAADRAEFSGAEAKTLAIAALRTSTEEDRDGVQMVVGQSAKKGRPVAFHPGTLPLAPGDLLAQMHEGGQAWSEGDFAEPGFLPRPQALEPGRGLPHLRLDRAAEFLIGDRL